MVASQNSHTLVDPGVMLNDTLEQVWHILCCTYDATANLPGMKTLFTGVDLSAPYQAAQGVIANMLLEVMESVGRFSTWYTQPARAFGLTSLRDPATGLRRWILAPEAVQKWQSILESLSGAIDRNYGLIRAMIIVDELMEGSPYDEPLITARCSCNPPRVIRLTQSVLEKAEIMCDACLQPFT